MQAGGFLAPFTFVGSCLILVSFITWWFLPNGKSMDGGDCKDTEGFGIMSILKLPAVQLAALNIWMATNSIGYLNATLEPHLRQVNMHIMHKTFCFTQFT